MPALWTGFALARLADPAALEGACRSSGFYPSGHPTPCAGGAEFHALGARSGAPSAFSAHRCGPGSGRLPAAALARAFEAPFRRLKIKARRHLIPLEGPQRTQARLPVWRRRPGTPCSTIPPFRLLICATTTRWPWGTFPEALNPKTEAFTDFPAWVAEHLDPVRNRTVAMFCTGGIRCEKAAAWMRGQGFEAVLELDGGRPGLP